MTERKIMKEVEICRLHELFVCDPVAGVLIWRDRARSEFISDGAFKMWHTRYAGKVSGCLGNHGYVYVRIEDRMYPAHRLIWSYVHRAWRSGEIDHINGNPSDNRISNLRECTHAENHQNRGVARNNVSGITGVGWHKRHGKWRADIKLNGKQRSLGLFETREEAHQTYLAAKRADHEFQPVPRAA